MAKVTVKFLTVYIGDNQVETFLKKMEEILKDFSGDAIISDTRWRGLLQGAYQKNLRKEREHLQPFPFPSRFLNGRRSQRFLKRPQSGVFSPLDKKKRRRSIRPLRWVKMVWIRAFTSRIFSPKISLDNTKYCGKYSNTAYI